MAAAGFSSGVTDSFRRHRAAEPCATFPKVATGFGQDHAQLNLMNTILRGYRRLIRNTIRRLLAWRHDLTADALERRAQARCLRCPRPFRVPFRRLT